MGNFEKLHQVSFPFSVRRIIKWCQVNSSLTNRGKNEMNIDTKNLALSNIEYLCLKMAAHPGKSARWYLRALHTGKSTSGVISVFKSGVQCLQSGVRIKR
jgi:hypothetical protein